MPGQAKCGEEPVTKLPQIIVCTAEGRREVIECPAAADGSVICKEIAPGEMVPLGAGGGVGEPMGELLLPDGGPAGAAPTLGCVTTKPCGLSGARCTDRGVLLQCDAMVVPAWIDCGAAGSTCVDGPDAHCACSGDLPAWASRCIFGQQLKCMGDRIERVPCTCAVPQ